ncbi:pyridoxamine 5'-phosphate oxidase family protein, partial [Methyloceanibacter marginalis]|uniref:pyridoxamine 5'-phosphate oxidase family protein n=1 Tax=Methyloceanibacter marginalis TaxID=1774971 RepID=UPI0009F40AA9
RGSRQNYARLGGERSARTAIDAGLAAFIAEQRFFLFATASRDGQPYIQHRGGPPGVLHVLDHNTLAFADFSGNRQYISTGNLEENPRAMLFLMDYRNRRRVKIWGRARVVENDPALIESLMPADYTARGEAAVLFTVDAWDVNCPQHIPQMVFADDVAALEERIAALENENKRLRETAAAGP